MMTYVNRALVDLLSEIFGLPRNYSHGQTEVDYNCPKCDSGKYKYNMGVNTAKGVFHCWACGYKGSLKQLIFSHGNDRHRAYVSSLPSPSFSSPSRSTSYIDTLQDFSVSLGSFRALSNEWKDSIHYLYVIEYLKSRGIDTPTINRWNLAYAESGPNKFRIIVPSRNSLGKLEYYVARAFYDYISPKYKNAAIHKNSIIFGEHLVNWDLPIILVEGVFDAMVLPNAIPILGTEIKGQEKLIRKIIQHKTPITIALDADAWEKAKKIYAFLSNYEIDVKLIRIPEKYKDINSAYQMIGRAGVAELLSSAHEMTLLEDLVW